MNEDLYELALKHLEKLEVENISDIEVRHVVPDAGEINVDGTQENNLRIDIYYKI